MARAGARGLVWLVPVSGIDGLEHVVLDEDLAGACDVGGCVAVCGVVVIPGPLVEPAGRRCVACAASPPCEPAPPPRPAHGYTRAMRRQVAAWLRRSCVPTGGFTPGVVMP